MNTNPLEELGEAVTKIKTPLEMLEAVKIAEHLLELRSQQAQGLHDLIKGLQWMTFRPAHFHNQQGRGKWSVALYGSLADIKSLGVRVTYPNGSSEEVLLKDLPMELWPKEQLPHEYHPRKRGEYGGRCSTDSCTFPVATMLNGEDDKFYCSACARQVNFQRPGLCTTVKSPEPFRGLTPGMGSIVPIQKAINKLNLKTLAEFARSTESIYTETPHVTE